MTRINCPSCNSIDMVQKVTAIVKGETHQSRGYSESTISSSLSGKVEYQSGNNANLTGNIYGGSNTNISSTQQSRLAIKLAPPPRPFSPIEPKIEEAKSPGVIASIFILIGIFLTGSWLGMIFPGDGLLWLASICVSSIIVVSIIYGLFSFGIHHFVKSTNNSSEKAALLKLKYKLEKSIYEETTYPRWEGAMRRWNSMFYCRRCDVVFVPGDNIDPVSPDNIIDHCHHGVESPANMADNGKTDSDVIESVKLHYNANKSPGEDFMTFVKRALINSENNPEDAAFSINAIKFIALFEKIKQNSEKTSK